MLVNCFETSKLRAVVLVLIVIFGITLLLVAAYGRDAFHFQIKKKHYFMYFSFIVWYVNLRMVQKTNSEVEVTL